MGHRFDLWPFPQYRHFVFSSPRLRQRNYLVISCRRGSNRGYAEKPHTVVAVSKERFQKGDRPLADEVPVFVRRHSVKRDHLEGDTVNWNGAALGVCYRCERDRMVLVQVNRAREKDLSA